MPAISSQCPVPPEQLPINEYESMRDSWFYRWGSCALIGYIRPLVIWWGLSWIVAGPVAAVSFPPEKVPILFSIVATVGALTLPALALVQLYVGWLHVGRRLQRPDVPYEESGWYDGQIWMKPEDVLSRDRLIMDYQVKPILRRIRNTFGLFAMLLLGLTVTWQFL
ncbi:MAG: CGLD27 family protein [Cyanobacteria bacterium]|nr:CGLD27 family protein [Cyanobacteriota bacterium]MDA0865072.1 CGLD27 family protein [Cyanobacteriota bacterium]